MDISQLFQPPFIYIIIGIVILAVISGSSAKKQRVKFQVGLKPLHTLTAKLNTTFISSFKASYLIASALHQKCALLAFVSRTTQRILLVLTRSLVSMLILFYLNNHLVVYCAASNWTIRVTVAKIASQETKTLL